MSLFNVTHKLEEHFEDTIVDKLGKDGHAEAGGLGVITYNPETNTLETQYSRSLLAKVKSRYDKYHRG